MIVYVTMSTAWQEKASKAPLLSQALLRGAGSWGSPRVPEGDLGHWSVVASRGLRTATVGQPVRVYFIISTVGTTVPVWAT